MAEERLGSNAAGRHDSSEKEEERGKAVVAADGRGCCSLMDI